MFSEGKYREKRSPVQFLITFVAGEVAKAKFTRFPVRDVNASREARAAAHSEERSETRQTMNLILQFAMILAMILHLDGKSVRGIVGDLVQFPVNCPMNGTAELYLEDGTENPPRVAARRDGVCTPGDGFTDRLDLNSCFSFSRSLYTDSGLYESRCGGGSSDHIQLDVVVASESSVSEGEPVTIRCYYKTAGGGQVETLRWEKSGVMVLEVNLSTKEITNGTGFEGKRLSAAGATEGDFSLTWDQAQVQDEGDYFCSVRSQGVRRAWGDPAAARLKVIKKDLDPTTPCPPQNVSLTAHSLRNYAHGSIVY